MNEIISLLLDSLSAPDPMLTLLIWGLYAGALIGILISLITRRGTHKAVSAIMKANAVDRDSACTISQLGLDGSYFAKRALRPSSPVLKYVKHLTRRRRKRARISTTACASGCLRRTA